MNERVHTATFLWGFIYSLVGFGLLGVGVGWWDLDFIDVRYTGPVVIIAIGIAILIGSLTSARRRNSDM